MSSGKCDIGGGVLGGASTAGSQVTRGGDLGRGGVVGCAGDMERKIGLNAGDDLCMWGWR